MTTEMIHMGASELQLVREPDEVVADAVKAARALLPIVEGQGLARAFGKSGRKHLQFEAWQTIGSFYGTTAQVDEQTVQVLAEGGYRVYARALKGGVVIGGAWSSCSRDEENWRDRPDFQLLSMAQTRAMSKALRSVLAYVAVLAGYEPTPAEEMIQDGADEPAEYGICPEHGDAWRKFSNENAIWYSHKQGNGWCNRPRLKMPPAAPRVSEKALAAANPIPTAQEPTRVPLAQVVAPRYPDLASIPLDLPELSADGKEPSFWSYAIRIWGGTPPAQTRVEATARLRRLLGEYPGRYREVKKQTWRDVLVAAVQRSQALDARDATPDPVGIAEDEG